jgi:hypothetical protein
VTIYRCPFAAHVQGTFEERDAETFEQRVDIECLRCGATYRAVCRQGMPRQHVNKFAVAGHLHRDPLAAKTSA